MSKLGRPMDKGTGTAKQAERGGREAQGTGDRNMGGREATPPLPPELPLEDDGNDARNIGG
jgi:hypothetical protein